METDLTVDTTVIDDLLHALSRVLPPDRGVLQPALSQGGLPSATQSLRYLPFNRQLINETNRMRLYSAMAVLNNRRAQQFSLDGARKRISQLIFSERWCRNPLDLYLNKLRCEPEIIALMDAAAADYTLFGILQIDEVEDKRFLKRRFRSLRPVLAIPHLDADDAKMLAAFENAATIRKVKTRGLPIYKKHP